ncbi:MAG: hypothetical protein NVSMB55_02550 [Mycobacteriales bacterium]
MSARSVNRGLAGYVYQRNTPLSLETFMKTHRTVVAALSAASLAALIAVSSTPALAASGPPLASLGDRTIGSTVAPNGDTNPYSLSVVPANYTGGPLAPGDVLVGDVNNAQGVQGKGTSIVAFHNGSTSLFSTAVTAPIASVFNANGTALWVSGFGPADDGSQGAVSVLHGTSNPSATPTAVIAGQPFSGGVIPDSAGPWGVEFNHTGSAPAFFWSNADGSIIRDSMLGMPFGSSSSTKNVQTKIAQLSYNPGRSFSKGTVVAPQGMAYDAASGILYVADSQSDQVVALAGANTASGLITPTVVLKNGPLHTPQGLAIDPNTGNLLVANGAVNNNLVEINPAGTVIATRNLDPSGAAGALFGLTTTKDPSGNTLIYYVNDNTNTLHELAASNAPVTVDGPAVRPVAYGSAVGITGTAPAGATVAIYFHRAGENGFFQRRTLQADSAGRFSTSYLATDDYRYYAKVGSTTSEGVLTQAGPVVGGPAVRTAASSSVVTIAGHASPGTTVYLHFHRAGTPAGDYSVVRGVLASRAGTWSRLVSVGSGFRYYATRTGVAGYQTGSYLVQTA